MAHVPHTTPAKITIDVTTTGMIAFSVLRFFGRFARGAWRLLAVVPQAIGRAAAMAYTDPFILPTRHDDERRY